MSAPAKPAKTPAIGRRDPPELKWLSADSLDTLKRNPQYLTPKQMAALKASIASDGFVAPILVRPHGGDRFEVVSGNHRLMAAREIGMLKVPCVVSDMDDKTARRLAVNLNLVHGNPPAELLAPFLAEMADDELSQIHLEGELKDEVLALDAVLAETLGRLEDVPGFDSKSKTTFEEQCVCPNCKRRHFRSSDDQKNMIEPSGS